MRRFTLRTLVISLAVLAVCAFTAYASDWLAALGLGVAALLVFLASMLGTSRRGPASKGFLCLIAAAIVWFAAVDRSEWFEHCPVCWDHCFVQEIRVCGLAIHSERSSMHRDNRSRLITDLGRPCPHAFTRLHKVRQWGFVVCGRPCWGCICCLTGDPEYYSEEISRRVREYAEAHPDDVDELYDRVMNQEDYSAMHQFIRKMHAQ